MTSRRVFTQSPIGQTWFVFDHNRRVYPKTTVLCGSPIWREHFRPVTVVGENKVTWLTSDRNIKVDKKTLEVRNFMNLHVGAKVMCSAEEVAEAAWVHENRHRIIRALERVEDAALLRAVDHLLSTNT